MPRSTPATQAVRSALALNGLALTAPDALGDICDPDTYIEIRTSGTVCTVTIQTPGVVGPGAGLAVAENVIVMGATASLLVYLDPALYRRPISAGTDVGKVYVDYSVITGVTRGVFV